MAKSIVITSMIGGTPDLNNLPYTGISLIARTPASDYGMYIITGTLAQLNAIESSPQIMGLCSLTDPRFDEWPDLDGVVNATVRNQLNTWLTKYSLPNIGAAWTYRQVFNGLKTIFLNNNPALQDTIATAFRTLLNTWLTARELTNVPAGWTYFQVCQAIQDRLNNHWAETGDIIDPAIRTRINTWATNNGYPNIPANFSNRQTVLSICEIFGIGNIDQTDVLE